ncbi:pyridoxal phosphate-dependent aminotransferase [soil metagenome]
MVEVTADSDMPAPGFSARRVRGFGTTIFSEVSALAAALGAVNLGQGFPDFPPPGALVRAATEAIEAGHNQYAPGDGIQVLRQAIAGHATAHYGLAYDPDREVTVTTGATEAVFAAIMALVDPGDEVIVLEPVYDVYPAAITMAGGVVRPVQLRPDAEGRWVPDAAELAAAVGPRTKALLLNSPHNPTGTVLRRPELEAIAATAIAHDLVVVTDEVYEHLTFGGARHIPIATMPGMHQRTVRISSAGKTFSVTGWKVGWACAPQPLTEAIRAAKQWITFTSGTPFQHAVAAALSWGRSHTDPLAADYARRRDVLAEGLQQAGLTPHHAEGTYFLVTDLRPLGTDDDVAFCRDLPARAGVAAIPVSAFHTDPEAGTGGGFVRWAFCKTDEMLAEGVRRLQAGPLV